MSKLRNFMAIAAGVSLAGSAHAAWTLNMPVGVTDMSREIHSLHMLIFWVCVVIAVLVFGAMIYSIATFRKSKGAVADTTLLHSTKVEVIWTIIPIVILVAMAVPAAETLVKIEDTRNSELTIKVTGYQWKWNYDYLEKNVNFFSTLARDSNAARQLDSGIDPFTVKNYLLDVDNRLVVPVDTKVRILLTAGDVIHAWWVPEFGVKKDAIPGFVNEAWFLAREVGVYRGQCAELCGRDHAFMPIVVEVKSKADFDAWLQSKQKKDVPSGAPAPGTDAPAPTPVPATPAAASHLRNDSSIRPATMLAQAE
jgi:cytochrome c oxidase subunit 2